MIKQILFIICILLPCTCIVQGELTSIRMYGPTEARDMNLTVDLPEGWNVDLGDPKESTHSVTLVSGNLTEGNVLISITWLDFSERPVLINAQLNEANADRGNVISGYYAPTEFEKEIDGRTAKVYLYTPRNVPFAVTGYAIDERTYALIWAFAETIQIAPSNDTIQILDTLHIEPVKAETEIGQVLSSYATK